MFWNGCESNKSKDSYDYLYPERSSSCSRKAPSDAWTAPGASAGARGDEQELSDVTSLRTIQRELEAQRNLLLSLSRREQQQFAHTMAAVTAARPQAPGRSAQAGPAKGASPLRAPPRSAMAQLLESLGHRVPSARPAGEGEAPGLAPGGSRHFPGSDAGLGCRSLFGAAGREAAGSASPQPRRPSDAAAPLGTRASGAESELERLRGQVATLNARLGALEDILPPAPGRKAAEAPQRGGGAQQPRTPVRSDAAPSPGSAAACSRARVAAAVRKSLEALSNGETFEGTADCRSPPQAESSDAACCMARPAKTEPGFSSEAAEESDEGSAVATECGDTRSSGGPQHRNTPAAPLQAAHGSKDADRASVGLTALLPLLIAVAARDARRGHPCSNSFTAANSPHSPGVGGDARGSRQHRDSPLEGSAPQGPGHQRGPDAGAATQTDSEAPDPQAGHCPCSGPSSEKYTRRPAAAASSILPVPAHTSAGLRQRQRKARGMENLLRDARRATAHIEAAAHSLPMTRSPSPIRPPRSAGESLPRKSKAPPFPKTGRRRARSSSRDTCSATHRSGGAAPLVERSTSPIRLDDSASALPDAPPGGLPPLLADLASLDGIAGESVVDQEASEIGGPPESYCTEGRYPRLSESGSMREVCGSPRQDRSGSLPAGVDAGRHRPARGREGLWSPQPGTQQLEEDGLASESVWEEAVALGWPDGSCAGLRDASPETSLHAAGSEDMWDFSEIKQEAEKAEVAALKELVVEKDLYIMELKSQLDSGRKHEQQNPAKVEAACGTDSCGPSVPNDGGRLQPDQKDRLIAEMDELQELLRCQLDTANSKLQRAESELQQRWQREAELQQSHFEAEQESQQLRDRLREVEAEVSELRADRGAARELQREMTRLQSELEASRAHAKDVAAELVVIKLQTRDWALEVSTQTDQEVPVGRPDVAAAGRLVSSLRGCEHELGVLLRSIQAQLQGGDAIEVLLNDPGPDTEVEPGGLADAEAIVDGLASLLEELRDIISSKSAESVASGCTIC
uniref:Uncharacterized protein n=1 Tax=Tetraselmis sp. GSL018 TaxID=582737 RepID=A0A061RFX8_9CHLO